jgi:CubicO group peptidase (beta-lactamase class C family)
MFSRFGPAQIGRTNDAGRDPAAIQSYAVFRWPGKRGASRSDPACRTFRHRAQRSERAGIGVGFFIERQQQIRGKTPMKFGALGLAGIVFAMSGVPALGATPLRSKRELAAETAIDVSAW